MARPRSIRTDQILDAARTVFLDQGLRAPTSAVAKAAGVSEGTIFKRFPTKEHLFFAAMGLPESPLMQAGKLVEGRLGTGDMQAHLVEISLEIVGFLRVMVPRMMMMCAHPAYDPVKLFQDAPEAPPLRLSREIGTWLQAESEAGRLGPCDGVTAARMLMGALHNFVFFEVSGMHGSEPPDAREYAQRLVALLWHGIGPHGRAQTSQAQAGGAPAREVKT